MGRLVRDSTTRAAEWWRHSALAQNLTFVAFDVILIWSSTLLAYFLRFQGAVPADFLENVVPVALLASIVFVALFWLLRLYHQVWRYVGVDMALRVFAAVAVGFALMAAVDVATAAPGTQRPVPVGTLFILGVFVFVGATAVRAFGRLLVYLQTVTSSAEGRKVLIVGAGDAGSLLMRDIENQPELGLRVVGFLDDDRAMQGRMIRSARVLGTIDALPDVSEREKVDEVLIALPSATSLEKRRVLDLCSEAGRKARIIPELVANSDWTGVADLRHVDVTDLLGREPVQIDMAEVAASIEGKTVAVTGAAGSIGSELCRQVLMMRPRRLLLLEIDESRLYEVFLELTAMDIAPVRMHLCDIRDERKLREVFFADRPDVVLHAAAYKHVPLMEMAPDEAVKTNVSGTRNVLEASAIAGVGHFVLISTDKAVKPTSMMGLTKALAERLALDACRGGLRTSIVRFGNVLGSRGSVVPLFEEQLRRGGPLLVTHPKVTRYFMTIPEAARLVLQAAAISNGGEVFVLEMGEPVRIVDLARKMIVLSGIDAEIRFTGLRPAEKMHEVLVDADESLLRTGREKILCLDSLPVPPRETQELLGRLGMFARLNDRDGMKTCLRQLMPDFVGHGDNQIDVPVDPRLAEDVYGAAMETLF
jgi:FlaA1/EpsC-like NDP-sugar epimerase